MFIVDFFQVTGVYHFVNCGTNIKIAEAIVLVGDLVNLLHGHRKIRPGHDEEDQHFYIHHIMDKAMSLHIQNLAAFFFYIITKTLHNCKQTVIVCKG